MASNELEGAFSEEMAADINDLVVLCHTASKRGGWWTDMATGESLLRQPWTSYVIGTKLMLIVSEVAEAMEGHRKGLMDDKLPERSMIEVEMADTIIRLFDLAGALKLDLGGAVMAKLEFNASREDHKLTNRQAAGGKTY